MVTEQMVEAAKKATERLKWGQLDTERYDTLIRKALAAAEAVQQESGEPYVYVLDSPGHFDPQNGGEPPYTDFSDEPKPGYRPLYLHPAPAGESEGVTWQPIETAPINKRVLLWKPITAEHYVAVRTDGGHGLGWLTPDGFEIFNATHWADLPEPPESALSTPTAKREE